jgi:acetylornithine deacetylase/succinyl-diaminopimelate desuccinylase-like protein
MRRTLAASLTATFLLALPLLAQGRPDLKIETAETFSAAAIPSYAANHADVYAYIDDHLGRHLEAIQRWVRQPSISAQNVGVTAMAEMLRRDLLAAGFREAELAPTSGHPGVFGFYDAGAEKTLVVYMMYDVQPIEPVGWQVEAFAGSIVDHDLGRVLMARGATNQKGPQRAFLNAVEAIHAVRGKLPVNLLVVAEGEEELGSPHYPEVIDRYEERLRKADGVFFPFNSQDPAGDVTMSLGVKGIVYFELEAVGNAEGGPQTAEVHGSLKAIVDSPVWRLVQALASLTTPDGNTITVPGYYDAIRAPTPEEQRLLNAGLADWKAREGRMRGALGVAEWIDGMEGADAVLRYLYDTTLNINGIWGGYTGEGVKTILPHKATAKVDSRLVPDQTPDEALALIRKHLDAQGFDDIIIRKISGYPPAQTSVDTSLVRAAIGVYNKHGHPPSVSPRLAGSAPYYIFTDRLGLPLVAGGIGHGSGAHAPNEYMVIEPKEGSRIAGLAAIEKFYVDLLYALAEAE